MDEAWVEDRLRDLQAWNRARQRRMAWCVVGMWVIVGVVYGAFLWFLWGNEGIVTWLTGGR